MTRPETTRISGPRCAEPLGPLDPRDHAWRDDLADIALADRVAVPSYAEPVAHVARRQVAVLTADRPDAPAASELLPGEGFAVLDSGHGHAWGYSVRDRYVGHVALDALEVARPLAGTAGMIGPGDALLFRSARVKAEVAGTLPMGAGVGWHEADERFVQLADGPHVGCFLHRRHLLPAGGDPGLDWVEVALGFVGAPYRWGGRSRAGVDCSGLVQVARQVAGHACRRDSDMQAADAALVEPTEVQRGDLAYWPGHIGIMLDRDMLLHANAHWMRCVVEPLEAAAARIEAAVRFRRP
jgi:hypothetical protein